jgi:hypothetical protein
VIRYLPGNEAGARLVQTYLGGVGTLVSDQSIVDASVVVVIGGDFHGVSTPATTATTAASGGAGRTTTTTKPKATAPAC